MNPIWLIILGGLLSIVYGGVTISQLMAADAGTPRMQEIAGAVAEGAQAYLKRQYTTISLVGVVILVLLYFLLGTAVAIGFLIGAVLSGAAGFIGMNVSVRANVRTAQAATHSLAGGLGIAFRAGAVQLLMADRPHQRLIRFARQHGEPAWPDPLDQRGKRRVPTGQVTCGALKGLSHD